MCVLWIHVNYIMRIIECIYIRELILKNMIGIDKYIHFKDNSIYLDKPFFFDYDNTDILVILPCLIDNINYDVEYCLYIDSELYSKVLFQFN